MILRTQQQRLELGSAEAIVHGDGVRRHSCDFPGDEGYCVPKFMKKFLKLPDENGDFKVDDESLYGTPIQGRVTRLNYYARSTTEDGAAPDVSLTWEEFIRLGKPLFLLRKRRDELTLLKCFNQRL